MRRLREYRLELTVAGIIALIIGSLSGCAFRIPHGPWPVRPDGTPLPEECTVEGEITTGENGLPVIPWEVVEGCDVPEPTPEPAPEPTPTPEPTPEPSEPTPTPAPTPQPTPVPEPSTCSTRFADYRTTCKWDCDTKREPANVEEPRGFGSALAEAAEWVKANSPDIVDSRGTVSEADQGEYARRVAERVRVEHGICAKSRPHDAQDAEEADHISHEEVAVWADSCRDQEGRNLGACRGHFDMCTASGAPSGRCFVGGGHRWFVLLGTKSGGGGGTPGPGPAPDPDELVLCEGTGAWVSSATPNGYSCRETIAANRSQTSQWLPLTKCGPGAVVDTRRYTIVDDGGNGQRWLRAWEGAAPACYWTNNNIHNPHASQLRNADCYVWRPGRGWEWDEHMRAYGSPSGAGCPEVGRAFDAAPPVARVKP